MDDIMRTWRNAGFALLVACSAAHGGADEPIPAGDPAASNIVFEYAVYFLPHAGGDLVQRTIDEAADLDHDLRVVRKKPQHPPANRSVWAHRETDTVVGYAPPSLDSLQYFGRGLTVEQAAKVQSSEEALVLDFYHPHNDALKGLRVANALVERIAAGAGGLIWDQEARLLYAPDEWRKDHVDGWHRPPDVARQIAIHSYKSGDYVRAITLGMAKFGQPDIVVDQFSWSYSDQVGNLINAFAQALVEGARFTTKGSYDLDLAKSGNAAVRERQVAWLASPQKSIARLALVRAPRDEGDPDNRLFEIRFDRYRGSRAQERQEAMFAALFGAEEAIARIRHSDELLALSGKARARLPELHKSFVAGLAPGEFVHLKVPFDVAGGGHEYMWVEVVQWNSDGRIKGMLRNEPQQVPDLHAGAIVSFAEDDVFDYILHHANGSNEGNETGQLILKMQKGQ